MEKRMMDLQPIIEAEVDATPGPWEWDTGDDEWQRYRLNAHNPISHVIEIGYDGKGEQSMTISDADMKFIALARTAIPEMIAEIQRLRNEIHNANH
jgi:hypothetical protein